MQDPLPTEFHPEPKLSRRALIRASVALPLAGLAVASANAEAETAPDPSESSDWHAYLTEAEKRHPLARYWYRYTPIADDVSADLSRGPMDSTDMLHWEDRTELSRPGYLAVENGYCMLPDGSGYVAVMTRFPGCTAEMLDWWFVWAQREENIRYKIWNPGAHYAMSQAPTPDFVRQPDDKPYWGSSRFPVEDIGMGVTRMRLDFVRPEAFGFGDTPEGGTILCVRVGLADGWLKHTDMIHHVRPVEGGLEMRSRFWMARQFEAMAGGADILASVLDFAAVKKRLLKPNGAEGMAYHCATEYSQLAGFLPELFEIYGGDPL